MIFNYSNFILFFSFIMNEKKRESLSTRFKIFVEIEIFSVFFSFLSEIFVESVKKKLRSLLSLFSLSWKWKFFTKDKISQRFDNFVKVSLTCVKICRFRLFNSSMISTTSFVEKYDLANTVTIIVNRLSVSMSVFFRLSVKKKKRNFAFDFVKFSISRSYDVVFFFSILSIFFDALSVFSILLNVVFFSTRFFVSLSSDYRDSFFVFRFRFLSKLFQERFHVLFHFSINLKKKECEIFFKFLKNSDSTAKTVELFSTLT